jgi:hypothetical protein
VRQFVTLLRDMAMSANAGLLLTSHPSLSGISTGTGLSGSTAWNASVRSRLYFKRATTEKDEEPDPDLRVLEVMKSNYGPVGETVAVRWKDGLFLPVAGVSSLERLAAEQKAEQLFLTLLDRFTRQGRNTCEKPSAPTYAPTLFAKESEARELGIRKADFEGAVRRLFFCSRENLPRTLRRTVQGNLKTGAQMIVEPLSNPLSNTLSNPCRTLCVAPPYTPGRQHSLPACMAVRCLPAVAGRRSWLKNKRNNKPGRAGERGAVRLASPRGSATRPQRVPLGGACGPQDRERDIARQRARQAPKPQHPMRGI